MSSPHASCQTDSWNVSSEALYCGWIWIINKVVRENGTISCLVKAAQVGCCFYETCHCPSLLSIISFMCLSRTEVIGCFLKSCNSVWDSLGCSLQTAERKLRDRMEKNKKIRADCNDWSRIFPTFQVGIPVWVRWIHVLLNCQGYLAIKTSGTERDSKQIFAASNKTQGVSCWRSLGRIAC